MIEKELSSQVLRAFYNVHLEHGYGFLESVYSNAMAVELEYLGLRVQRETPVTVHHRGKEVGRFRIDLLVEEKILVEVKTNLHFSDADQKQLLNYLKATPQELGLLLNFGPEPSFLRRVLSRERKHLGLAT